MDLRKITLGIYLQFIFAFILTLLCSCEKNEEDSKKQTQEIAAELSLTDSTYQSFDNAVLKGAFDGFQNKYRTTQLHIEKTDYKRSIEIDSFPHKILLPQANYTFYGGTCPVKPRDFNEYYISDPSFVGFTEGMDFMIPQQQKLVNESVTNIDIRIDPFSALLLVLDEESLIDSAGFENYQHATKKLFEDGIYQYIYFFPYCSEDIDEAYAYATIRKHNGEILNIRIDSAEENYVYQIIVTEQEISRSISIPADFKEANPVIW
ncbi:MAG: hypothetical protein ACOC2U_03220 [bacterium]